MRYVVTGQDGESVEVEAFDWMMAMVQAIEKFGIEVSGWACQTRPDGSVVVTDPMSGRWWEVTTDGEQTADAEQPILGKTVTPQTPNTSDDLVSQTVPPPPPPSSNPPRISTPVAAPAIPTPAAPKGGDPTPKPAPRRRRQSPMTIASFGEDTPLPVEPRVESRAAGHAETTWVATHGSQAPGAEEPPVAPAAPEPPAPVAPPSLAPAKPSALGRPSTMFRAPTPPVPLPIATANAGPPEDLAERLFDLSFELSAATDGNDACRQALNICLEIVRCEAGSVLRGGLNHAHLTFVAVAGPAASQLLGRTLPFGQGIIGASFDLGITIQVDDVQGDPRHVSNFDTETGFRTRSVLSVPVQGRTTYHGAIQLLNPASGHFQVWHRDAVEQLAASLASTLDGAHK
ncbi:MAG: GAF domain-containing protein [Myxococcota bacterium]